VNSSFLSSHSIHPSTPPPQHAQNHSDRVTLTPLTGGGTLLAGWQTSQSSVVLAIAAPNATATAAELAYRPIRDALYTNWFGPSPDIDPLRDDPLASVLPAGTSLLSIVEAAAGPASPPMRVTVTGFAAGGGLARGVALWAAGAYPLANLRLVTFGAPRVGDARFDWASEQLVDLAYHWAAHDDPTVYQTLGNAAGDDTVEGGHASVEPASRQWVVSNHTSAFLAGAKSNGPAAAPTPAPFGPTFYVLALQETFVAAMFSSVKQSVADHTRDVKEHFGTKLTIAHNETLLQDRLDALKFVVSNSLDKALRTVTGKEAHDKGSVPISTLPPEWPDHCSIGLCKLRRAVVQANNAYWSGPGTIGANSETVEAPKRGTVYAIAWAPETRTATIAFRGTASAGAWVQDFDQVLTLVPVTPILHSMFPEARVHQGFLEQFEQVASKALGPSWALKHRLLRLSGGVDPALIIITGHSLGGGVANIASVWASAVWPAAAVRVATFGAPKVGNAEWNAAVRAVVGRQWRVVNAWDMVPELPILLGYEQGAAGAWLPTNASLVLGPRPPPPDPPGYAAFNWDDHACTQYRVALLNVDHVSAPDWVLE
jgi:hypothetical protein